ncbi:MAG TPA: hypothetical protein GXZ52_07835 [Clostridiales bacterium]|nr:hypothetical protein [Clostridiales bacterium]
MIDIKEHSKRKTLLRRFKFRDPPFDGQNTAFLIQYEHDGKPAIGIYINEYQIGNVPKEMVSFVLENADRVDGISAIEVYGGGQTEDGERKYYGAKATLRLHKNG